MSTNKIRGLLKWARAQDADTHAFDGTPVGPPSLDEVQSEIEAIEKAAKTLDRESLGDWVYEVRERAASESAFAGNAWGHPRVTAFSEATRVISTIAKEGGQ